MAKLEIEQIPVLRDSYIYLLHEPSSGATAVVDPSEAKPVLDTLAAKKWQLSQILNTHHHDDHVGGNAELKLKTACRINGGSSDARRIPGIDVGLSDGSVLILGGATAVVMWVPGHTSGHLAYWFSESHALFCGDTLFAMGCGRLFEGTAQEMWASLQKLRSLPDDTLVYCSHEYTLTNARFALTIEGGNEAVKKRVAEIEKLRAENKPTVPSRLDLERATNPFLRADVPEVKAAVGMAADADPALVLAELRRRRDAL